ncbi:hypothetical protein QZH41_002223 [Actinostola sp. cb2023]|nr:hypothetical protein QZH41_002223 [Actinostola sp. cb2023]
MGLIAKGDIFALKMFTGKASTSAGKEEGQDREAKKKRLLEIVNSGKIKKKDKSSGGQPSVRTRKFNMGWIHYDEKKRKYIPVRYAKGGGSRQLDLPADSSKEDVIVYAKSLFFPDDQSIFGTPSEMDLELGNFSQSVIHSLTDEFGFELPFTLDNYFKVHKLSRVRLYLMSKCHLKDVASSVTKAGSFDENSDEEMSDDETLPPLNDYTKERQNESLESREDSDEDDSIFVYTNKLSQTSQLIGTTSERDVVKDTQDMEYHESLLIDQKKKMDAASEVVKADRLEKLRQARKSRIPPEPGSDESSILIVVKHRSAGTIKRKFCIKERMVAVYDWVGSYATDPEHYHLMIHPAIVLMPFEPVLVAENNLLLMGDSENPLPLSREVQDQEVTFIGYGPATSKECLDDTSELFHIEPVSERIPEEVLQDDEDDNWSSLLSLPLPLQTADNQLKEMTSFEQRRNKIVDDMEIEGASSKLLWVERWNILPALMEMYRTDDGLVDCVLQFRFKDEMGCDYGGLSREVYSLFWKECSMQFFEGNDNSFVPRHSGISKQEYITLGKIMHHAFLLTGIFPVSLNQAYIQAMLLGDDEVPEELLLRCYIQYLGPYEGSRLEEALNSPTLEKEDKEFIIELEDRCGMRISPDATTVRKIAIQIACSELLQLPMHTMASIKQGMTMSIQGKQLWQNISKQDIDAIYSEQSPCPSKVTSLLVTQREDLSKEESKVFGYLKRYVASTDQKKCESFLSKNLPSSSNVNDEFISDVGSSQEVSDEEKRNSDIQDYWLKLLPKFRGRRTSMSSKLVGQELKCLVVSLMKSSTTLNEDVKRNTKKNRA